MIRFKNRIKKLQDWFMRNKPEENTLDSLSEEERKMADIFLTEVYNPSVKNGEECTKEDFIAFIDNFDPEKYDNTTKN